MRKGRYYLGRVIKLGNVTQQSLQASIIDAPVVEIGKFDWTITDVIDGRTSSQPYIFGNLTKYAKDGKVTVVDEGSRQQVEANARNLLEASSPFVYLPDFSGIAYLHVWNGIQEDVFPRRFQSVIEAAHENFFAKCHIDPVSDYKAFYAKLKSIDTFTEISAKVFPPNPLFGRLWGELHDYIKHRNASEVSIKETSDRKGGLDTEITRHIGQIIENPDYQPEAIPTLTDAALLMAADGHGVGKAVGLENGYEIVIKTTDTQKSFLFTKSPNPEELAALAHNAFQKISKERDMRH